MRFITFIFFLILTVHERIIAMSDEVQSYNSISKVLHWGVAFLILGLLFVGFYMKGLVPPFKFEVYGVHKALGMVVLATAVLRIIWKHASKSPKALDTHAKWEKFLSKTIHIVLYILMVAMPLSGWMMSSAGGYPVSFFGLFEFPAIVGENKQIGGIAHQAHTVIAYALIICVGLHIVGALKHHVIDKDLTMTRMGAHPVLALLGLLLLAAALYFPAKKFVQDMTKTKEVVAVEGEQKTE